MSKTSLFSPAIFRRNLRGYWPLWVGYLVIMIMAIPISAYNMLNFTDLAAPFEDLFVVSVSVSRYAGFAFAVFAAMAVFSFMYSPRSANMTAALPIKRGTMFVTCTVSIITVTVAVHVIVAIVTLILELSLGSVCVSLILKWLALGVLETFFFTALAVFCSVLTGNILMLPCVYAIFNFAVLIFHYLLQQIFSAFLYGYCENTPEIISWLTPIVRLEQHFDGIDLSASGYLTTIIVYAVFAVIMLAAALFIFKARPTERASDIVAVKLLRPVAKYCAAVAGSLTIGLLLYVMLFDSFYTADIPGFIVCMIIGGFIGYIAADMLIKKTFRVFKKLTGFVFYAVFVILFTLALIFDVFGYEKRLPDADKVQFADFANGRFTYRTEDTDSIEAIIKLQEECIENRSEDRYHGVDIDFYYEFEDGSTMERIYSTSLPDSSFEVFNKPEIRLASVRIPDGVTEDDIEYASVDFNYDAKHSYYDSSLFSMELTPAQFLELYNTCIVPDTADSSLGGISGENRLCLNVVATISGEHYSVTVTSDAARTLAYLENLGVVVSAVLPEE